MAAITNAIRTTEVTELIPADVINDAFILPPNRAPNTGQLVCWGVDMGAAGLGRGSTFRFPALSATDPTFTEASPRTEADDGFWGTLVKTETTETTATAVVVGLQGFVTDEALQDSGLDLQFFLRQQAEGMRKRISLDILLNTPNATNSTDKNGEQLTIANWNTWWSAWSAQDVNVGGEYMEVAALDTGAFGYLANQLSTTGASIQAPVGGAEVIMRAAQGLKGSYRGVNLLVSNDVAENGGSDHSNAIMAVAMRNLPGQVKVGSPLACVNWLHDGIPDVFQGLRLEAHRDAINTAGYYLTAQARYGTTITNNTNMRELIAVD